MVDNFMLSFYFRGMLSFDCMTMVSLINPTIAMDVIL
jgi:hypothetical protein